MRTASIVILMTLLVAPVPVRGEDAARPVAAGGTCSVPADEHWTPQERFVWSRVCVGEEADFNKEPGYGGDLDPKNSSGLPDNRILTSLFLETILLHDNYRTALTRRGVRIIGARFTEIVDLENAELGHDLWLDRSALEKGANFSAARATHRITIDGSKVSGPLYLNEIQVGRDLTMHNGSELADVDVSYSQIGGKLDFSGSQVNGKLNMEGIEVAGHLVMNNNARFTEVNISSGHVRGVLSLWGSKVTGTLNMLGLQIDGMLSAEGSQFGDVTLWLARVGGLVRLTGSKITGKLDMQGIQIARPLHMSQGEFAQVDLQVAHVQGLLALDGAKITGPLNMLGAQVDGILEAAGSQLTEVNLSFARIGGELRLDGSKLARRLDMQGIRVGGDLNMNNDGEFAEIDLTAAQVHGVFSFWGSKVAGPLNMFGIQLDGALEANESEIAAVNLMSANVQERVNLIGSKVTGAVSLEGGRVGGDLILRGAKINGQFDCSSSEIVGTAFLGTGAEFIGGVVCHFAKLGELELAAGTFHRTADFAGAQIRGELRLGSSALSPPKWQDGSLLVLRNAKADAIQDSRDAWPARLDLTGFTYRSLGGANAGEGDPKAARSVKSLKNWLRKQQPYASAPYEQVASVLRSQGRPSDGDEILYASKERERAQADFPRILWLTAMKWFIGYSYHVERTLFWIVGFLVTGVAVLRISGEGRRNRMPFGIAYSFDMLLPIIQLREKHKKIDLQGWPRYYFYTHKIMGYVLASFLIAGLAGLTK